MAIELSADGSIHHIGLRVPDAAATKIWYQHNFGFTVELEFSVPGLDIVWLRAPGSPHVILEW
jgi:catechol 2,3-dioxygenase-like lactoylglutathione lyase family enzyme